MASIEMRVSHNWVTKAYDNLFDGGTDEMDEGDREVYEKIVQIDPSEMVEIIRGCVDFINKANLDDREWARYTADLLEWEEEHKIKLFIFTKKRLDINWKILENLKGKDLSKMCYILELAFSNAWFGEALPTILDLVYDND